MNREIKFRGRIDRERRYYQTKHNEEQCKTLDYLDGSLHERFAIHHFPEALQAYTDAVCKAQKKECLAVLGHTLLGRFCSSERMFAAVENTPQPKIEAL